MNDFKDTIFESATREDVSKMLTAYDDIEIPLVPVESEYTLAEAIEKDMEEAAAKRELVAQKAADQDLDEDFKEAKKNLRSLAERQQEVLDDLIALAKASDSPRAYEVVSTMINTFAELENKIMDLHKKKADIQKTSGTVQKADKIENKQNNFFVGSHKEMSLLIKKLESEEFGSEDSQPEL